MKEIGTSIITDEVERLCREANYELGDDVLEAIKHAFEIEESPLGKETLRQLIENARIAREEHYPLCQDCGTAVVFLEIGQDVHITGGYLYDAIEEGVRRGYIGGYLRKSIVTRPFSKRYNTRDNTPPVIHTDIVPGESLKITVMSKGGGAENMSRLGYAQAG